MAKEMSPFFKKRWITKKENKILHFLTGYIHNGGQYACPYLIPDGWMYVNNGYWYADATLVVRCIG